MDTANPLVTVIMPTFNRAHLIMESLDCIKNQTYTNWECVIVDDGSTDDTELIIQDYLNDTRFQYYKKNNEGAAIARNYAVSKSKGTYILPLDSDDLIDKTYIGKGIAAFIQDSKLKLVYGLAEKFGEEHGVWPIPPFDYQLFLVYNMIFNSAIYKRADYDRVGGYSENNMFEDWDFWIKILKNGGEVYQIPETMYYYRTHKKGSVTTLLDENKDLYKNSMDQLFKNHADEYLKYIGNPIELERERRTLASITKSSNYRLAMRIIDSNLFKLARKVYRLLKPKNS